MRELFHGWRRENGVVTLVMTSVFMAGWVQGQKVEDEFRSDEARERSI
jgi:hypothetical protein